MTATDAANGQTISIRLGHTLTVTLNSTYWTFNGSSNPSVLEQAGQPTYEGTSCVPGGGCGTASIRFKALAPGTAVVSATRTTCGEALACGPDQSRYSITVIVTA
jgi:predicted secreted protein